VLGVDGDAVRRSHPDGQRRALVARSRAAGRSRPAHPAAVLDLGLDAGVKTDHLGDTAPGALPAVQLDGEGDERAPARAALDLLGGDAEPAGQQQQEVLRSQQRVEVGVEVVQGGQHRREQLVDGGHQPLGEVVTAVQLRQRRAERLAAPQTRDRAPHPAHLRRTRTWCS
jgi:hypothetical protein